MYMDLCFETSDDLSILFIRDLFCRLLQTNVSVQKFENLYIISCNRNYDILKKIKRGVYVQLNEYKYIFVTHYTPSKL